MASLLQLKADIEDQRGGQMRMVFSGATEAHLLASDIGQCRMPPRLIMWNSLSH